MNESERGSANGEPGRLILITGGVRSGKSPFAERYATTLAGRPAPGRSPLAAGEGATRVCYVATAEVRDAEMADRVARHQARRPADWRTVEAPRELRRALAQELTSGRAVVLVDSVDSWVSNRLLAADPVAGEQLDPQQMAALEEALLEEATAMAAAQRAAGRHLILVTLEAGLGVIPPYPLGRAFRDLLGRVNTTLAAAADEVYLLVAGLPVEVKALSAGVPDRW